MKKWILFSMWVMLTATIVLAAPSLTVPGNVNKGEMINILVDTGTNLSVNQISLDLMSDIGFNFTCRFNDAGIISGCVGMSIEKNPLRNISGNMTQAADYSIAINSSTLFVGKYSPALEIRGGNQSASVRGNDIRINGKVESLEGCSVRGKSGFVSGFVNNARRLQTNKLNFFIPSKNAAPGEGYLTSQQGRDRISYKFIVNKVLDNDKNKAMVFVKGLVRVNLGEWKQESSVIILDKKTGDIILRGNSISVESMFASFMNRC